MESVAAAPIPVPCRALHPEVGSGKSVDFVHSSDLLPGDFHVERSPPIPPYLSLNSSQ